MPLIRLSKSDHQSVWFMKLIPWNNCSLIKCLPMAIVAGMRVSNVIWKVSTISSFPSLYKSEILTYFLFCMGIQTPRAKKKNPKHENMSTFIYLLKDPRWAKMGEHAPHLTPENGMEQKIPSGFWWQLQAPNFKFFLRRTISNGYEPNIHLGSNDQLTIDPNYWDTFHCCRSLSEQSPV